MSEPDEPDEILSDKLWFEERHEPTLDIGGHLVAIETPGGETYWHPIIGTDWVRPPADQEPTAEHPGE